MSAQITPAGVRAAAKRLQGIIVRTPLIESPVLNELVGARVFLKAEVLQHYGSFKLRGAYNLMSQLTDQERAKGVVAWSSGNHAQGVAYASKLLGCEATIVMPSDAPSVKIDNVKALGGQIVFFDRYKENREDIGKEIAARTGAVIAPSYDHPHIIEGQGTLALETIEDMRRQDLAPDAFVFCCGGGGLAAGGATILQDVSPQTALFIAEPEGYDETWASIRDRERRFADVSRPTICDAIATPTPGALTLPILEKTVVGGAAVTEPEVIDAMIYAYRVLKLVIEPGGAVALASILSGKIDMRGKTAAVTLSGGNIDIQTFISLAKQGLYHKGS